MKTTDNFRYSDAYLKYEKANVNHPDFKACYPQGAYNLPVIVFERAVYRMPTPEQREKYREDEQTVKAHGGVMKSSERQCAGANKRFNEKDTRAMLRAVRKAFPDHKIYDSWNGVGTYSFSVSIRHRDHRKKRPIR